MTAQITCPKCGKTGSLKKEIPPEAKIRCSGCQTSFSPDSVKKPDEEVTESVIGEFLGPPISNPSTDPIIRDEEPMGAPTRPQRSPPTASRVQPPKVPATSTEPATLSSATPKKRGFSKAGLWSAFAVGGLLFLTIIVLGAVAISGRMKSTDAVTSYRDFLRGELGRIKQIPDVTLKDSYEFDVQKTESLVSPLLGNCAVTYVWVWKLKELNYSVLVGGNLEMTHAFQDGKWTMTTGRMTMEKYEAINASYDSKQALDQTLARLNGVFCKFTTVEELRKALGN